jgi:ubiquinone biosynthesis UbiH/UbiF/VisC/COQ6 family hydroxylase
MSAPPFDICIRGDGIVGRTLALLLAKQRLRLALVAAPSPTSNSNNTESPAHADVRAYALNHASRTLLESVRCWPDDAHATAVVAMQVQGEDGGQLTFCATDQSAIALNWIVDVPTLEAQLAQAVRFQPLIEVFDTPQNAALTVVCEGKTSTTRSEFGVDFAVTPYPQWALAARVQCADVHAQVARQWFNQDEILAFLPLGGAQGNACALVWSTSPARAQALRDMAHADFCAALSDASRGALGELHLTSERHIWPLQQATATRWSGTLPHSGTGIGSSAWVLAGDAAHNVHPLAGQGLNLGLADAAELARILDGRPPWRGVGDARLLRQYERTRKAECAAIGHTGDVLQQLFTHPHPAVQSMRNWGMQGFERSGPLKHWIARRAMGVSQTLAPTNPL